MKSVICEIEYFVETHLAKASCVGYFDGAYYYLQDNLLLCWVCFVLSHLRKGHDTSFFICFVYLFVYFLCFVVSLVLLSLSSLYWLLHLLHYNVVSAVSWFCEHRACISLHRRKNRHGHWVCFMSTGRKNGFMWRTHTRAHTSYLVLSTCFIPTWIESSNTAVCSLFMWRTHTVPESVRVFLFFFHPIYYLPPSILSLLVVTQIRGHIAGSSPFLPTTVRALHFYREKLSALSSLVDSRQIVLTHARRAQQLILFLFLQIESKSCQGGIRTHGLTLSAFEGYH